MVHSNVKSNISNSELALRMTRQLVKGSHGRISWIDASMTALSYYWKRSLAFGPAVAEFAKLAKKDTSCDNRRFPGRTYAGAE